jgi:hypothetical protein
MPSSKECPRGSEQPCQAVFSTVPLGRVVVLPLGPADAEHDSVHLQHRADEDSRESVHQVSDFDRGAM